MIEHNGKMYARVSEIIKPFVDFSGIDEQVLSRKAMLGTKVHEAIDQEIRGEMAVLDWKAVGYLQSWEKWKEVLNPEFVKTEERHYCDLKMITGCIDALVKFPGSDRLTLIDWKTSAIESPITWPMQAHLYYYLATRSPDSLIEPRFLFVKLDRYGGLPMTFTYKFNLDLMEKCMKAIDDFWTNVAGKSSENV